jgi:hypothetical protein
MLNPERERWIKLYKAALLESESSLLPGRIADARAALTRRLRALHKASGSREGECLVIEDALNSLRLLDEQLKRKVTEEVERNQREAALERLRLRWPEMLVARRKPR